MAQVFVTVLPLFLLIGLGALLRAVKLADDRWTDALNRFGLYAAFPALVVKSLTDLDGLSALPLSSIALNLGLLNAALFVFYGLSRFLGALPPFAASLAVCGVYGNIAYLGIPFVTSVYPGTEGAVILHVAVYLTVLFTSGLFIMERARGARMSPVAMGKTFLSNPLSLSILLGLALFALGFHPPEPARRALGMLGNSASPAVLVGLGVFMGRGLRGGSDLGKALLLCGVKLLLLPAIFLLCYKTFWPEAAFRVSILEAAMPVGLTAFALTQMYPLERGAIAYAVTLSTLLSGLILPLLVALL